MASLLFQWSHSVPLIYKTYINEEDSYKVTIAFPSHHSELRVFFKNQGFKHYFFSLRMEYNGSKFEDTDLKVRHYLDSDFYDYLRIYSEGFYDLLKTHDMKPHLAYSEKDYEDEILRKSILEESKGYTLFLMTTKL